MSVLVVGTRIVPATDQGKVRAFCLPRLEPEDWLFQTDSGLFAAPVAEGAMVYVGAGDGQVSALNVASAKCPWWLTSAGV
jgi:hypothetical protein